MPTPSIEEISLWNKHQDRFQTFFGKITLIGCCSVVHNDCKCEQGIWEYWMQLVKFRFNWWCRHESQESGVRMMEKSNEGKKLKIEMGDIWCWFKVWNLRQGHSPGWVFPGLFIQMVSGTLLSCQWSSLVRTQGSLFLPSPPCVLSIILTHHFTYCVLMPASSMSISFQTTDAPF